MFRPTAVLALALCAASCAKVDGPPEQSPPPQEAVLGETRQAVDSNETPSEANAIRFLEQSSFGPKLSHVVGPAPLGTVEHVVAVGIPAAINEQLSTPPSVFDGALTSPALDAQFFVTAVTGPDQLRQRVAFALSQIMVISEAGIPDPGATPGVNSKPALATYLNLLSANAFGNFRDLLEAVTRNPAMGRYLDMVNNRADSNNASIKPNENYAREMLQLFTLGQYRLNINGTLRRDEQGNLIRAYTEDQVQAFARTLSGWTYGGAPCPGKGLFNPVNYVVEMIPCGGNHDSSSQELLRGFRTTADFGPDAHLRQALNNVFTDPNVPPFISKQLIQHLVTSNPTPAYVGRVANVFKDDGTGTRGNLAAVVRAILTDTEARGATPPATLTATFGHLRSPALFVTSMVRWLEASLDTQNKNPGARLALWSRNMSQWVPRPPSVFSYYPPNAPLPVSNEEELVGPEFAILDTATVTARANFVHDLLFTSLGPNSGITIDYALLPNAPAELVPYLGRYWLHGTMSQPLQQALNRALYNANSGTLARRQKLALYLLSLSPSYQIQR